MKTFIKTTLRYNFSPIRLKSKYDMSYSEGKLWVHSILIFCSGNAD